MEREDTIGPAALPARPEVKMGDLKIELPEVHFRKLGLPSQAEEPPKEPSTLAPLVGILLCLTS
jgi:hypothetical protein